MFIEKLEWDSNFFGFTVGKVSIENEIKINLEGSEQFDLIYFFVNPQNSFANKYLSIKGAVLVDEKITFLKDVKPENINRETIYSYKRTNSDKDLEVLKIGFQSGLYSRFNIDKNFSGEDFTRLYAEWINKSIDREIAKEVFVSEEKNNINGIITVGIKNDRVDIGIIAVDESERQKNIGMKLISQAELYAFDNGFGKIQVVTQRHNAAACKFYQKCGFSIESIVNVYHLWHKKKY